MFTHNCSSTSFRPIFFFICCWLALSLFCETNLPRTSARIGPGVIRSSRSSRSCSPDCCLSILPGSRRPPRESESRSCSPVCRFIFSGAKAPRTKTNPFPLPRAKHLYACKIKETTNGRWRRARRETRKTIDVIAQRGFKTKGEIDERKTIARVCENKTQKVADEKAKEALRDCRQPLRLPALEWAAERPPYN